MDDANVGRARGDNLDDADGSVRGWPSGGDADRGSALEEVGRECDALGWGGALDVRSGTEGEEGESKVAAALTVA